MLADLSFLWRCLVWWWQTRGLNKNQRTWLRRLAQTDKWHRPNAEHIPQTIKSADGHLTQMDSLMGRIYDSDGLTVCSFSGNQAKSLRIRLARQLVIDIQVEEIQAASLRGQ